MTKIPLRCEACGKIVGSATISDDIKIKQSMTDKNEVVVEYTQDIMADAEMDIEQHAADCPILVAFLEQDMKVYSIGIYLPNEDDEYPEGHGVYCPRSCDHPCHQAYDKKYGHPDESSHTFHNVFEPDKPIIISSLCQNPECPEAGHCGGECARRF